VKTIFSANTDWYLYNFRLDLALYLQNQGLDVLFLSPPGNYAQNFASKGFRWLPLTMQRRSLNPCREGYLVQQLYKIYKQEQPDFVHNFTIKNVVYGALAAQAAGIEKRIHAITGLGHVFTTSSYSSRILRFFVQVLLKLALRGQGSRLILQNGDDQQLFLRHQLIRPDRLHLIRGSGVNTQLFRPSPLRRDRKFKVLLAARLLWEKGIQEYVEAAGLLAHRSHELEFFLAGASDPGNPNAVPEAHIKQWQESGLITILGHVDRMQELLAEVDLVVLPSFYGEGIPRSLLEAAAAGLPLITTESPGCREVVDHGINGFLIPIQDAAALAEKIAYLLDHPQLCRHFGQAGREKTLKEFDQQLIFEQTWQVYRSLGL
jgi:glycosyltransferase involved in cell wall biosynthesis